MYEPTDEDIDALVGNAVKDIILEYTKNPKTGLFSRVGKICAFILQDDTRYTLHGTKLPTHRFGDYVTDHRNECHGEIEEFEEMVPLGNNRWEAKYKYHSLSYSDPYSDYKDDWEEMADEGAQFSWMD